MCFCPIGNNAKGSQFLHINVSNSYNLQVYLFEQIGSPAPRDVIRHLKCIVFVRPTPENVQLLTQELRNPKYAQYYICKFCESH